MPSNVGFCRSLSRNRSISLSESVIALPVHSRSATFREIDTGECFTKTAVAHCRKSALVFESVGDFWSISTATFTYSAAVLSALIFVVMYAVNIEVNSAMNTVKAVDDCFDGFGF